MDRFFSDRQKREMYVRQDGCCAICGVHLGPGWHGDHVIPFSKGGPMVDEFDLPPKMLQAGALIGDLQQCLSHGLHDLELIPLQLKRIIREELWRERFVRQVRDVIRFNTFAEFVRAMPPEGLNTTIEALRDVSRRDQEALDLLDQAMQNGKGGQGGNKNAIKTNVDNIHNRFNEDEEKDRPAGTSAAAALRRLRRQSPELHQRVLEGELSPHAAAVLAGFRRKTITVPIEPERAAAALARHFSPCERETIARLLMGGQER